MRYRKTLVITLAILLVLVGARLALPSVVKRYVNDTLHSMEAYDGSVADIDIHLWQGAYRIGGLRIVKVGIFQTIVSVLRNAFIGAFSRSLEGSISLHDVKENLKEVRGGGDNEETRTSHLYVGERRRYPRVSLLGSLKCASEKSHSKIRYAVRHEIGVADSLTIDIRNEHGL